MLDSKELLVAPKNPFNARTASEFKKTATAIRREPWNYFRAAEYLEDLVDLDRRVRQPPVISAIFAGFVRQSTQALPLPDVADVFAPGPPRTFLPGRSPRVWSLDLTPRLPALLSRMVVAALVAVKAARAKPAAAKLAPVAKAELAPDVNAGPAAKAGAKA